MKDDNIRISPAAVAALARGDLDNAIVAMTPGGIEAQEAAGQAEFVANSTLPKKCLYCQREQFEQMGIVYGEDADDLFVNVQLPEGWRKERTSHSMWSKLLDDKGRERASIFYKAAFYDRGAHIGIKRRYTYSDLPVGGYDNPDFDQQTTPRVGVVEDRDTIIWQSEPFDFVAAGVEWFNAGESVLLQAKAWLEKHYPDWQDPLAYWDEA